jgi:2-oxoglutarate ferredoxin oxidoreductase subunit beta
VVLEHGKPMIYGKERDKGLILDGFTLKAVTIGENGVKESDILVHDAACEDTTLHMKLALMEGPEMPIALGVIRDVVEETYDAAVETQIAEVQAKSKVKTFDELIDTLEHWEM